MHIRFLKQKPKLVIVLVSALVFLTILPLVLKINYVQNDEWVYFSTIKGFLSGNFHLDPKCAPTFYAQGLLAALFSIIFGLSHLPVLTLLISAINFGLFSLIIYEFYGKSILKALLVSAILFFNPFHMYSALGFMTENYLLAATLASLYLYLKYKKEAAPKYLNMFFLFSFIALMEKQTALALPISVLIYSVLTGKRKDTVKTAIFLVATVAFYIFIFPKTPEMAHKSLQFHHLLDFKYTYSLIYGIFIMLTAFAFPLVLTAFFRLSRTISIKGLLVAALLALLLFFGLNKIFTPMEISWGEFPYFENTFERGGFYPRNIDGTKYLYRFNYDLYRYWDLLSKVLLASIGALGIAGLVKHFKTKQHTNFNNIKFFYVAFMVVYLPVMVIAETFYDRYYYLLIVFFVLILLEYKPFNRLRYILAAGFTVFLIFMSYQFSMDFVLLNRAVWTRSQQLVSQGLSKEQYIKGTKGWRHTYPSGLGDLTPYKYVFSYDPTPPELFTNFPPVEKKTIEIKFPFSIWVNSRIYQLKYQ